MTAIMKSLCFSFVILASLTTLITVADARRFNVGGNGVWVINPQENYNTWAERNRFQVNDTLYFKYAKGSDSVQQVMKADFDGCNIRNPIKNFDNGESVVTLDRSGPFYFISGNEDHCKKGQKLIVVVLAVRNHPTVPISPAKPPSTAQPPKSPSPVSPVAPSKPPSQSQPPKSSVSPAQSPRSSSPVSHSPTLSPSHAPAKSPKTPSPSPKSPSPVSHSPAPSHAPTTLSPSPKSPSPASSPSSSSTSSPDQSPTSSPEQTPPSSPSPTEVTPPADNITAPAPSPKNSASGVAVTSVMTTVLSVAFTGLMFA